LREEEVGGKIIIEDWKKSNGKNKRSSKTQDAIRKTDGKRRGS
jgi:hypothetical protein